MANVSVGLEHGEIYLQPKKTGPKPGWQYLHRQKRQDQSPKILQCGEIYLQPTKAW
jgi:hypothetical protein